MKTTNNNDQKRYTINEKAYILTNANPGEDILFILEKNIIFKKEQWTPIIKVTRTPVVKTVLNWHDEVEQRKSTHTLRDEEGNTWYVGFPKREDGDYLFMPGCEKVGVEFKEIGKFDAQPLTKENAADYVGHHVYYFSEQYSANSNAEGVDFIEGVDFEQRNPLLVANGSDLKYAFVGFDEVICIGDSDRAVYVIRLD